MKACAHLQQTGHSALDGNFAGCRFCDAAQDFQQRGFARSVAPDDADAIALFDVETDLFESPKFFVSGVVLRFGKRMDQLVGELLCAIG